MEEVERVNPQIPFDAFENIKYLKIPGMLTQSVMCLATDACLTANPRVASSIPDRSHIFVEIDHEMISMVILLPSADHSRRVVVSYKLKYVQEVLVNWPLVQACPGKSGVR